MTGADVLKAVGAVAGVSGGFVVAGAVRGHPVLFHYDLACRACSCHFTRPIPAGATLHYLPEYHTVVAAPPGLYDGWALDLGTGRQHAANDTLDPSNRAAVAWQHCFSRGLPDAWLQVVQHGGTRETIPTHASDLPSPRCEVDGEGRVSLYGVPPWGSFTPRADGRAVLRGVPVLTGQCRGDTLALVTLSAGPGQGATLRLFRGPHGAALASLPLDSRALDFALSADGRLVARRHHRNRLEIHAVDGGAPSVITQTGGFSGPHYLELGRHCLLLMASRGHTYQFQWITSKLIVQPLSDPLAPVAREAGGTLSFRSPPPAAVPDFLNYDPERFVHRVRGEVAVVADRYGQVAVFDRTERLVCMFFAFRQTVAGWMPDGTRFGPAWLTGGPESAGAMERFGRALARACERGGPPP
jgi:hypothetical protein